MSVMRKEVNAKNYKHIGSIKKIEYQNQKDITLSKKYQLHKTFL